MNEIKTPGIILSVMPIGEYDRRVEILTSDLGRISVFARGARKPGSSLVSVTRLFAAGVFELYQGKTSYSLKAAVISDYFDSLSADLDRTVYGTYFLEAARYFSRENVMAADMVNLLFAALRAVEKEILPLALIRRIFELKLLDVNGLCPAADKMAEGQGAYIFASSMSPGCSKAYDFVLRSPAQKVFSFKLSETVLHEFEDIVERLMKMNVDREFKSLQLIDTI